MLYKIITEVDKSTSGTYVVADGITDAIEKFLKQMPQCAERFVSSVEKIDNEIIF